MLEGKIAIVTGASSGIGNAITEALAREKAIVVMAARSIDMMTSQANNLKNKYGSIVDAVKTDLTSEEDIKNLFKYTINTYGIPNILVNSAGVFVYKSLKEMSMEEHNKIFQLNYTSVVQTIKCALENMSEGVIINISSQAGMEGFDNETAYCASKFALNGFSQSLDKELENIRVYALCPGLVDTPLARKSKLPKLIGISDEDDWKKQLQVSEVSKKVVEIISNYKNYSDNVIIPLSSERV